MPSRDRVGQTGNVVQPSQPWQLLSFAYAKSHIRPSHLGRISFITRNRNADVECHVLKIYGTVRIGFYRFSYIIGVLIARDQHPTKQNISMPKYSYKTYF